MVILAVRNTKINVMFIFETVPSSRGKKRLWKEFNHKIDIHLKREVQSITG